MDTLESTQQKSEPGQVDPEGPTGFPGLSLFLLWRNVLRFLSHLQARYGDVARVNLMGTSMYLISHPKHIGQLFRDEKKKPNRITKNFFYAAFKPAFGDGLFNSDGTQWQSQRELLQPYFQKSAVKKWFPVIVEETLDRFQKIQCEPRYTCDLTVEILPVVQGVMSKCLFNRSLNDKDAQSCVAALQIVSESAAQRAYASFVLRGFLNKLPTPGNRRFHAALETIDQALCTMRNQCLAEKHEDTFFSTLARQLTAGELRDQLFTLFFAGQDTSVNAIVWTAYYLALHPDVEQRLRAEIESVLIKRGSLTYEQIDSLSYTRCVVMESMRLTPPAYAMYRNTVRELTLAQYRIKKNTVMTVCPYVTHRHPALWENPDQFNPDRFMSQHQPSAYAYFPFGGGKRICLGQHLAMMEIVTVTALFVASFRFKLLPKPKVIPHTFMTLRPKYGVPMTLESTGFLNST